MVNGGWLWIQQFFVAQWDKSYTRSKSSEWSTVNPYEHLDRINVYDLVVLEAHSFVGRNGCIAQKTRRKCVYYGLCTVAAKFGSSHILVVTVKCHLWTTGNGSGSGSGVREMTTFTPTLNEISSVGIQRKETASHRSDIINNKEIHKPQSNGSQKNLNVWSKEGATYLWNNILNKRGKRNQNGIFT